MLSEPPGATQPGPVPPSPSGVSAAVAYAFLAPVDWSAALTLGLGCFAGAWMGPAVVRRLPEAPLRIAIALAGLGLAWSLWREAAAS